MTGMRIYDAVTSLRGDAQILTQDLEDPTFTWPGMIKEQEILRLGIHLEMENH